MYEVDRTRRVSELIKRELTTLISRELDDQRVKMTTVTAVTVSRDLKRSTVYVSSIGDTDPEIAVEVLNKASGYLRRLLGKQLSMRTTPALHFKHDDTIKHGLELSNLIDELVKKDGKTP